ncbi:hypothetical protein [Siminovitchia sp. 179-K 8D1 HS]|uniref:hypothetical protein n=1 Tax=Siminovitchia sp. 179-K 8D1 HS TaxID=3142385 RepID=UPI0039A34F5F
MLDRLFDAQCKIIEDPEVNLEIKLLLILELSYNGEISLAKAKELCSEVGLFSEYYMAVDDKATSLVKNVLENSKNR